MHFRLSMPLLILAMSASAGATNAAPAKAVGDCMGDNKFTYHAGTQLVPTTTFLAAGNSANFILKEQFKPNATYYVKFDAHYLKGPPIGGRNAISASQIPDNHPYITSGLANKGDTLASVSVPAALGSHWMTGVIRIYACENDNAPSVNSTVKMYVSSTSWSTPIALATVVLLYVAAAFAFRTKLPTDGNATLAERRARERFLDPVIMTAGIDGRGSLAKLQILFFSIIVFVLLLFILLRTGELSDLSQTILLLLGIAAIGSTAAKGTDNRQNQLEFENASWLAQKNWIGVRGLARTNEAKWSDILTTDGEFDVYRYQSCIFSLIVGGALLVVGVNQLATFEIPATLLGILGLSQVVYVTGKLVSPPALADLNKSVKVLRELEQAVQTAAARVPTTNVNDPAIAAEVKRYREAAAATAASFHAVTNLSRPTNLDPSLP